jgi:TRAP-type C4-dicarboxylate transport system substrate-binding protein
MADALYHSLGVVEGVSGNYRNYNLTGLTEILKNNIQFNHLVKVLAAKYSVFSKTPPEYILAFTLASTAYIVMSQNRIKAKLNEPVVEMGSGAI